MKGYGKLYTTIVGLAGLFGLTRAHHIAVYFIPKGIPITRDNFFYQYIVPMGQTISARPVWDVNIGSQQLFVENKIP